MHRQSQIFAQILNQLDETDYSDMKLLILDSNRFVMIFIIYISVTFSRCFHARQ